VSLTGLKRESVHIINGSDISTVPSHEISGTVEPVGHSVQGLTVGDRVVGFNLGNLNTHQIVSNSLVQNVRDEESVSKMVSPIMPYATAVHGLASLARV
jgi:NADPH:quinone reductase-like Zn-dependent oxidoreductase